LISTNKNRGKRKILGKKLDYDMVIEDLLALSRGSLLPHVREEN
jgi:hypothetical protein